jgi:hypothetical protein
VERYKYFITQSILIPQTVLFIIIQQNTEEQYLLHHIQSIFNHLVANSKKTLHKNMVEPFLYANQYMMAHKTVYIKITLQAVLEAL